MGHKKTALLRAAYGQPGIAPIGLAALRLSN